MLEFYKNKNVFITGHTGFKGSWLCQILLYAGANITGFALEPSSPSLYTIINTGNDFHSIINDIRDRESLVKAVQDANGHATPYMGLLKKTVQI